MGRIRTDAARAALRDILSETARAAAGSNTTVSRDEGQALEPFLDRAEDDVRAEGGKGTRVTVSRLVGRAMENADALWEKHNPSNRGTDSTYLAEAEVRAIAKDDPALGALTRAAVQRAAQDGPGIAEAVHAFFSSFDFKPNDETGAHPLHHGTLPGGSTIDARPLFPENRAALPPGVLESYDFYRRAMDADIAGVTLHKGKIGGHDVYVVFTTTDGDDGYPEVRSKSGKPVASARLQASELIGFDEVFGRARFSPRMVALDEPVAAEGYSEPEERAAHGQVPSDWPGEAKLEQGTLHFDANDRLGRIEIPGLPGSPHEDLATAAFEYLWERSLKFRVHGSTEPFLLGPQAEGTMVVGSYTRPTDGKVFEVADWRDIDDGSFTLYFDRTPDGRLKLAIEQFNN